MKRIVDLSYPITNCMPVYPGDPDVHFRLVHTIKEMGYNVTEVTMGVHAGTHVDAPSHCMYSDHTVDGLSLDVLTGWTEVLNLGEVPPNSEITAAHLDVFANRVGEGARVLLRTNWSKHWEQPDFFSDYPGLTEGAAMWLNARKVKLLGIEQPSVHQKYHKEVHEALLSTGMVLIESVANLDQLQCDRVYLVALPLKLVGIEGSPMRVIAMEGVDVVE